MPPRDLTDSAIAALAAAVFQEPDPWVAEAYSAYDAEPLVFRSAGDMADYAQRRLALPKGYASFFLRYPDMRGRAVPETIRLDPGSVPGHRLRHTWQGWGLISLQLAGAAHECRVSSNSLQRALAWASTYSAFDPPDTWDWKAVARHTRRLQRALKKAVSPGPA